MTNRIATLPEDARARARSRCRRGMPGRPTRGPARLPACRSPSSCRKAPSARRSTRASGYGARVILHGEHVGDTFAEMERIRDVEGLTFVHPFDDPAVIAGHGIDRARDHRRRARRRCRGRGCRRGRADQRRRIGREGTSTPGPDHRRRARTLERDDARPRAGTTVVTIQPQSVADGLGAPFAGRWTLAITKRLLDGIVLLDDATILAGMRFAVERLKQVVEPAGAAALAAVLSGSVPIRDGERVVVVVSGRERRGRTASGNCSPAGRCRGRSPGEETLLAHSEIVRAGRRRCRGGAPARASR